MPNKKKPYQISNDDARTDPTSMDGDGDIEEANAGYQYSSYTAALGRFV